MDIKKLFQTVFVLAIIAASIYLALPSAIKLFDATAKSNSESNTESAIKYTRDLYATLNMNEGVTLPFKIEFNGSNYKIYSQGNEFTPSTNSKTNTGRELPNSGYIEIREDGSLDAQGLKYNLGGYVCSQTTEIKPVCVKG